MIAANENEQKQTVLDLVSHSNPAPTALAFKILCSGVSGKEFVKSINWLNFIAEWQL
jgi:hypothetical protein